MINSSSSSTGSSVESAISYIKDTLIFQNESLSESYSERDLILNQFQNSGKIKEWVDDDYVKIDGQTHIKLYFINHSSDVELYFFV